jgi:UDP-3-O-[3-hydroxymyristoyl] N-acetylglucosamine deacetylase
MYLNRTVMQSDGCDKARPTGWHTHAGTLADEICVSGRGLHTGRTSVVRIKPLHSKDRQRIVFRRLSDDAVLATFPADIRQWRKFPLCSTLAGQDGFLVRTVEHLLAALLMCEIDQAVVEIEGEEVPILDGAAAAWVRKIAECGRVDLPMTKRFIRIVRPFTYRFGDTSDYGIEPCADDTPNCSADISVRVPGQPRIRQTFVLTPDIFAEAIAPARTYGPLLWGLPALVGGFLSNTPILRGFRPGLGAVLFNGRILGGEKLPDECLRHRLLDMIGDFALAGAPLLGKISVHQPSHRRNVKFIRSLLRQKDAWQWAVFA